MKIGKLDFKAYAAKKPVTLSPAGEFVTAAEIASSPRLSLGSLFTLDGEQQLKLALERYSLEPDFRLAILGVGILTKDEVIEHLEKQTEFGRLALRAEMGYCNELIADLSGRRQPPSWPTIPDKVWPDEPFWKPETKKMCISFKIQNRALFCENTTDSVTTPFANYRLKNVHSVFKAKGFTVVSLTGTDDVRTNFVPQAKNPLTVYLSGVGHGGYNVYTGHWHDHILEVGKYGPAEVKGKAIHFLSCQTGRDLGPDTVKHGSLCYAGYTENFILMWDDGSTPAVNEFELFARSDSTFDIAMAKGATAKKAFDSTIQAFNAARAKVPNTVAATYLTWDRDHLKLHGNQAAKIKPYRWVKICFPFPSLEEENALVMAGKLTD